MYSVQSKTADAAPIEKTAAGDAYAHLKPGDAERGRELYSQTCVACHGANGEGAFEGVPNLMIVSGLLSKPDEILLANMINGFQSAGSPMAMPPRGGNPDLTDQDLAHVLAFLRTQIEEKTGDRRQK
ncbi:MAG TPA: cytochrome c, class I [Parvularcula sp.]|nr:cytochrome c, class I [Parvularcula sp.]